MNEERPLLFVLTEDFGELCHASQLLFNQPLAKRAVLLLPPRVAKGNGGSLPHLGRSIIYDNLDTVLRTVEALRPSVVFLFCGYSFTVASPLASEPLSWLPRLIALVKAQDGTVVTSDPLLGSLHRAEQAPHLAKLHPRLAQATEHLRDVPHFYPLPCTEIERSTGVRVITGFNPLMGEGLLEAPVPPASLPTTSPWWFFLLSQTDFRGVEALGATGLELFTKALLRKFEETRHAGRIPVFLGPAPCRERLASARDGTLLLDWLPHLSFHSLLMKAECAFYWNWSSASAVPRVAATLPTFYFHKGHLLQMDGLEALGVTNYFHGNAPPTLDMAAPLDSTFLLAPPGHAAKYTGKYIRALPSPVQVVASLESAR